MSKNFLVVVDMQNDFIDGSLGTKEAQAIVPNVVEKIKNFEGEILVTLDTHDFDYLATQEGINLPVPHCIKMTKGWALNDKIASALYNKDYEYFEKGSFASFDLADRMDRGLDIDYEIEIVGLCTDICVVSNALLLKSYLPEIKITVDASCCAGVTLEKHKAAIETMKSCQINVIGEENE